MPVSAEKDLKSGNRIRFCVVAQGGGASATITTNYLTREPSSEDRQEANEMLQQILEAMGLEMVTLQ